MVYLDDGSITIFYDGNHNIYNDEELWRCVVVFFENEITVSEAAEEWLIENYTYRMSKTYYREGTIMSNGEIATRKNS